MDLFFFTSLSSALCSLFQGYSEPPLNLVQLYCGEDYRDRLCVYMTQHAQTLYTEHPACRVCWISQIQYCRIGKPPYLSWLSKEQYINRGNFTMQLGPVFSF